MVVAVFEVLEVVLGWVVAGADAGGEVGVGGAVDGVWSEGLAAAAFFSPVAGAAESSPADGFILSE